MKQFSSAILILPGLGDSGPGHWQTLWQQKFGFERVIQANWETPVCDDWIDILDRNVSTKRPTDVILVGHSLACCTIVNWAKRYHRPIKGALLVAPSDTEGENYPDGTRGFIPMPSYRLSFPSIVVTSSNDVYVTLERACEFADTWGSRFVNVGDAGHINVASGHGEWNEGLQFLRELDNR